MRTHKVCGQVGDDGSLTVESLPFPAGEEVQIIVIAERRPPRDHTRYPLRGTGFQYLDPTSPVAEDDWAALR